MAAFDQIFAQVVEIAREDPGPWWVGVTDGPPSKHFFGRGTELAGAWKIEDPNNYLRTFQTRECAVLGILPAFVNYEHWTGVTLVGADEWSQLVDRINDWYCGGVLGGAHLYTSAAEIADAIGARIRAGERPLSLLVIADEMADDVYAAIDRVFSDLPVMLGMPRLPPMMTLRLSAEPSDADLEAAADRILATVAESVTLWMALVRVRE